MLPGLVMIGWWQGFPFFTTAAITLGVLVTLLLGILPSFALDWAAGGAFAVR